MPSDPAFDSRLLKHLACPACFGFLLKTESGADIVCTGCARSYPLVDGIPVLIRERAKDAAPGRVGPG